MPKLLDYRHAALGAALAALCAWPAPSASAGEITLFYSRNQPHESWRDGQGATLTLGLIKFAQVEVEGARATEQAADTQALIRTTYFTAGAAVKLPITRVTPFAGVGAGVYHQSLGSSWKINTLGTAYVGVKVRIADLIVLRGEYRRIQMRGTPFNHANGEAATIDSRISVAAGIAF